LGKIIFVFEFSRWLVLKIAACDRFFRKKGATFKKKEPNQPEAEARQKTY
jgi:hypothetical protein